MDGRFSPSLRVLSSVPRWGIVRVLQRQSVADHSFYVAMYADGLASLLGWPDQDRASLLQAALWHDADEVVSGDIPGPVKRQIPCRDTWDAYLDEEARRHFGGQYVRADDGEIHSILVVANLLDEVAYLAGELRSGNHHVLRAFSLSRTRLEDQWHRLDLPEPILNEFIRSHATADIPLPEG